jgi:adenine-specific DNA-methyltransferase
LNKDELKKILLDKNLFFKKKKFKQNEKWLIFKDSEIDDCNKIIKFCKKKQETLLELENNNYKSLKDVCHIANGLVSGLDKAFILGKEKLLIINDKERLALKKIIKAFNLRKYINNGFEYYIFLNDKNISNFEKEYPNFFSHLKEYKEKLLGRYNYDKDIKYWEWVFLRNFKLFNTPKNKISVPCKHRVKSYDDIKFSFTEKELLPTQDVTSVYLKDNINESIYYLLAYLNSELIKKWIFINNNNRGNILEFSEKPLNEIPFRSIDWTNKNEVEIHNKISKYTEEIVKTKNFKNLNKIENEIKLLFK